MKKFITAAAIATFSILAAPAASAGILSSSGADNPTASVAVLGARLNDNCTAPGVLEQRLDIAANYLHTHPLNPVYVTGGKTSACPLTEAQYMEAGLRLRLVPNVIIRDDKAGSTVENARNVSAMSPTRNVVVITTPDHIGRALGDFRAAGMNAVGVSN